MLSDIREAASWGIIDGVTTNPSLIKKAAQAFGGNDDVDMESYIKQILAAVGRLCPVSLEVPGLTADEMIEQGRMLYEKYDAVVGNVVIKIPVCTVDSKGSGNPFDGIVAISELSAEKIPINATLVFTPEQALLAAKAGAEYVSPFAGRIDDRIWRAAGMTFDKKDYFPMNGVSGDENGEALTDYGLVSGVELVARVVEMFEEYEIECEVIAASLRNAIQVRECAAVGADIATIPFDILKSMIMHPGTADGIDAFTGDLVKEYTDLFVTDAGEK